jgi:hypothetical protein
LENTRIWVCLLLLALSACGKIEPRSSATAPAEVTFKPKEMADALHSVIAADREVYSRHILQRLATDEKLMKVSENWQQDKALPSTSPGFAPGFRSGATKRSGVPLRVALALANQSQKRSRNGHRKKGPAGGNRSSGNQFLR